MSQIRLDLYNSQYTVDSVNKPLTVEFEKNIVYISGVIQGNLPPWSPTLKGIPIGHLPDAFKPEKRLIFMTYNKGVSRIDITREGHIILVSSKSKPEWINLTGIHYSLETGNRLQLSNGWMTRGGHSGLLTNDGIFRPPTYSKHKSIIYLSGIMTGGFMNREFGTLPIGFRPRERHIFAGICQHGKYRVDILPDGSCRIFGPKSMPPSQWFSLNNISYDINENVAESIPLFPNWENYKKGYQSAKSTIHGRIVQLGGLIRGPIKRHNVIGVLPVGHRPTHKLIFYSHNFRYDNDLVRIDIYPDGSIRLMNNVKPNGHFISLNNINFLVDHYATYSFPHTIGQTTRKIRGPHDQSENGDFFKIAKSKTKTK